MKFALKLPKRTAKAVGPAPETGAEAGSGPGMDDSSGKGFGRFLDRKRALRVVALLSVAWAAGQLMQTLQTEKAPQRVSAAQEALGNLAPTAVISVSGEADDAANGKVEDAEARTVVTFNEVTPAPESAASAPPAAPELRLAATLPTEAPKPAAPLERTIQLADAAPQLQADLPAPLAQATPSAQACPVTLDLSVVPGAMLGVTLIAPCAPNARVVLQHEGLTITGVTTSTGALFIALPALTTMAAVKATLPGTEPVTASLAVPQAADYRRFAVQWQGDDAFQVNAYENGAAYGQPGHVSELKPNAASAAGGFLQVIGDPASAMPLLAQVYTYPLTAGPVAVEVESAVTAKTCGRELIGETLFAQGGRVVVTDLTLAMPDCDAIGDFLVLNNLVPDVTLATN